MSKPLSPSRLLAQLSGRDFAARGANSSYACGVNVGLLGALVVEYSDGSAVTLAAKERALVAALALRPGRSVPVARLVSALWGDEPPSSSHKSLQTYISRLRRVLPPGVIVTTPEGYMLKIDRENVDVGRFEMLLEQATVRSEAGDPRGSVRNLVEALAMWRGGALIDLVDQPMGIAEAARLEELQRGAEEDLIEARLSLGEHHALVADAEAAVAAEPVRERRWGQLMMALYRSGRQADALRTYRRLRDLLGEELGIEPSAELATLEEAILLHKPELAWSPGDDRSPLNRHAPLAKSLQAEPAGQSSEVPRPSGVVTFVLTDIVGSTAMWNRDPRLMADVLERHDQVIADAVCAHGGVLLKSKGEGDSTMSVFARATAGVTAGVAIQQSVKGTAWPVKMELRLRVAIETGEAYERDGDYFGPTVNRAARLRSLAIGGQVLCTSVTAALVRDQLPDDVRLADRGGRRLPGFVRADEIYELIRPGSGPDTRTGTPRPQPQTALAQGRPTLSDRGTVEPLHRPPLPAVLGSREWFVGRTQQLEVLADRFARAQLGGVQMVVVMGEPGIGKTALAAKAASSFHRAGATVLFGNAEDGAPAPYKPWLDALSPLVGPESPLDLSSFSKRHRRLLAQIFPELTEADEADDREDSRFLDPQLGQHLFMRAIGDLLVLASEYWPIVVVLGDLHWADTGTVRLLRRLSADGARQRLLLLLTYRDTEISEDHPFRSLVVGLRPRITEIELRGLPATEVGELLGAAAGYKIGQEGTRLVEALESETAGNPLFILQMVRHLVERGDVTQDPSGRWSIQGSVPSLSLPRDLLDVVGQRVVHLRPELQSALAAGSVLSDPFELALLARMLGTNKDKLDKETIDDETLVTSLEEGERRGLLVSASANSYRFAHAIMRDAVYQRLSQARRSLLHRRAAAALQTESGPVPHDEIARHLERSGQQSMRLDAIAHYEQAGAAAVAALSPQDAAVYYQHALRLLGTENGSEARICEVKIRFGETLRLSGDAQHRELLLDALKMAVQLGRTDLVVDAARAAWRGWASRAGSVDAEWVQVLEKAITAVGTEDRRGLARLLALLAIEDSYGGKLADANRRSHESLQIAQTIDDDRLLLELLEARYQAIHVPECLPERVEIVAKRQQLASRVADLRSEFVTAHHGFQTALEDCRIQDADVWLDRGIQLSRRLGDPTASWITSTHRFAQSFLAGRLDEAYELAKRTYDLGKDAGHPDAEAVYAGQLFFVFLYYGRVGELLDALEMAVADYPHIQAFQSGLVTAYCETGHHSEASRRLDEQLQTSFSESRRDVTWLGALVQFADAAAFLRHRPAAQRLVELLSPFSDQLACGSAVVFGPVATSLARLTNLLGARDRSVALFERAVGLTRSLDAPLFRAQAEIAEGEALIAWDPDGGAARVRDLATEASRLASDYPCPLLKGRASGLLAHLA